MGNRWMDALVKTLITLVVVHVLLLVLGMIFGNRIGWFGLRMLWPHWQGTVSAWISIGLAVLVYFGIYALCTDKE